MRPSERGSWLEPKRKKSVTSSFSGCKVEAGHGCSGPVSYRPYVARFSNSRETRCLFTPTSSIPFFRTYPGMYVPAPIQLRSGGDVNLTRAAIEVLGLSKMNWNNAQLDEREPLTLRTARRVGGILKHSSLGQPFAARYAYYM